MCLCGGGFCKVPGRYLYVDMLRVCASSCSALGICGRALAAAVAVVITP